MDEFTLLRPQWLWMLLPLVLIIAALWKLPAGRARWTGIIDPHLQQWTLDDGNSGNTGRTALLMLAAGWLLATLALAGPAWEKLPQPVHRKADALVLVLDLSASMYAQDLKPSRLHRARYKLHDILERRTEGQTALIAFAGDAFVVAPFSDDVRTLENQLQQLDPSLMPVPGSRVGRALDLAEELVSNAGLTQARILLATDGLNAHERADTLASARQHPVDVLAVGTAAGGPIPLPDGGFLRDQSGSIVVPGVNYDSLRTLAEQTGGRFVRLQAGDHDLDHLLSTDPLLANTVEISGRGFDQYREEGPWLLLILLPLAASAWRRGWLASLLLLVCLVPPQPALAMDWEDLWKRTDQRGQQAFRQGDYEAAGRLFDDPAWAGSALYRNGDFETAAEAFATQDSPQAHYNRGNALARAGRLDEALKAYEQALAAQPEFEDAAHNLELVRKALEQQQQAPAPENQQDQQEQESQNSAGQQNENPSAANQEPGQQQSGDHSQADSSQQHENKQAESPQSPAAADRQQDESGTDPDIPRAAAQQPDQSAEQANAENAANLSQEAGKDRKMDAELAEQLLRRVPDDPGGLLRYKFQYQYQQRQSGQDIPEQTW